MSREQILGSIRNALATAASGGGETSQALGARWHPHAHAGYQHAGEMSERERITLFTARLHEYDAEVVSCESSQDIPAAIAAILQARGKQTLALPPGFPEELLPQDAHFRWMRDEPALTNAQLDAVDGVVTMATAAVAVSGSVVLQHGPSEGRRVLTLLPDFHLCVLHASQLVETLPEAMARLQPTATRPTTFFSGPSATADIEMTRIKGVHGPRFLAILLVLDTPGSRA